MNFEITLEVSVKIHEKEMNINGLIKTLKDFSTYCLGAEMLTMLVESLDRQVCEQIRGNSPDEYENKGYRTRQLQTSLGRHRLRFLKLKRKSDNTMSCPGLKMLDLKSHARWPISELISPAGMLPFMSYRNSAKESAEQQGHSPSKTTLHRRLSDLVGAGDFQPHVKKQDYRYLLVDGTGARFQGGDSVDAYQGEVRFAYASKGPGCSFDPLGLWVNKDWKACAADLYSRMKTKRLEVLICDGEAGIASAFQLPHMRIQRCQWHAKRDLSFILYADGAKKDEQRPILEAFENLPMVGWSQAGFEDLADEHVSEITRTRNQIVRGIKELGESARAKGYVTAATYLLNLAEPFVTCLDHFIETGKIIPITSNIIERQIGLFKNRFNRIGRRWSEKGLTRWFAIAMRKLLPQFDWKDCWKDFYGNKDAVKFELVLASIR